MGENPTDLVKGAAFGCLSIPRGKGEMCVGDAIVEKERYLGALLEGDRNRTSRGLVRLVDVDEGDRVLVALVRLAIALVFGHSREWGERRGCVEEGSLGRER